MSTSGLTDNDFEMLDLIDEDDKVICQMEKAKVHSGIKVLHREIGVLIYDHDERVLLQQRSFKKKFFPGSWTTTAVGHVPAGKTPEEAAHMELMEELGFDTDLTFVEKRKYVSDDHISLGFLFVGKFPHTAVITLDKDEVEQAKFVTHLEISTMNRNGQIDYHTVETLEKFYHKVFTTLPK